MAGFTLAENTVAPEPEGPFTLTQEHLITTPPEVTSEKAMKFDVALGEDSPGKDELVRSIDDGAEGSIRDWLKQKTDVEFQAMKQGMIADVIANREPNEAISELDLQLIQGLTKDNFSSVAGAKNIMETEYAKKVVDSYLAAQNDTMIKALEEDEEKAFQIAEQAEWAFTNQQIALGRLEEVSAQIGDSSWFQWGWDFAESMVPAKSWINIRGAIEGMEKDSILPGSSLREQINYLHTLPPKEFASQFNAAFERVRERNMFDAQQFAQGVLSYPTSDEFMDNMLAGIDIADIALLGSVSVLKTARGLRGLTSATKLSSNKRLAKALEPVLKAGAQRQMDVAQLAENSGDPLAATFLRRFRDAKEKVFDPSVRRTKDLEDSVPTIAAPSKIMQGSVSLGNAAANRITARMMERSLEMMEILSKGGKVGRLTDEAEIIAQDVAARELAREYHHVGHNVIDIARDSSESKASNIASVTVLFGKAGGTDLFNTEAAAKGFATKYIAPQTDDFEVVPVGSKFGVTISKDIDESKSLADQLMIPSDNDTPTSAINTFLGKLRTPKDVTSRIASEDRSAVVHGQSALIKGFRDILQDITVPKKDRSKLGRILKMNRDAKNYKIQKRGMFYENIAEFEKGWFEEFKEFPSESVTNAYFAYVQANDFDLVIRDFNWYKSKSIAGLESWEWNGLKFDGKAIDNIPDVTRDENYYGGVLFDTPEGQTVQRLEFNRASIDKKWAELKAQGYQMIQVSDSNLSVPKLAKPEENYNVSFVVTSDYKKGRVGVKNVERNDGGHKVDKYPFYVKQGNVRFSKNTGRSVYSGDKTLLNAHTLKEAQEVAKKLDDARKILKEGGDIEDYVNRNLAGVYSVDEVTALFNDVLSLEVPVMGVTAGERTGPALKNIFGGNFVDTTNSPFNIENTISKKFGGERSLENVPILTEESGALKIIQTDNLIDPVRTLEQSISSVINDAARTDYIHKSIHSWITEFNEVLDGTLDELRANPQETFFRPKYNESFADKERLQAAKNIKYSVEQFMGYKSQTSKNIDFVKAKIAETVYGKGGVKALDAVADWLLPSVNDPFQHMRSFAFNTKLGLFNPVQLFLQAQTTAHVFALAGPKHGLKGIGAGGISRALLTTNGSDEMIEAWAKMTLGSGWKTEDFIESHKALRDSGYMQVGGEVSMLNNLENPSIIDGTFGKFLSAGRFFFNEGERIPRLTGWHAAYSEWRSANPGKALTRADRNRILSRADDMAMNMTSASNASWQRGFASVPTQFFAYQIRLMEQLLSKRLTWQERARIGVVYSSMYGVPIGATAGFAPWPMGDEIKKELLARGIEYDDTVFEALVDGIPAVMYETMLGQDLDFAGRYGPQGLSVFKDIMNGDTQLWEAVLGASGSIGGDVFTSGMPAVKGLVSLFTDDAGDDDVFPIVVDDLLDLMANISTVSNATKTIWGINTGQWLTKNGVVLSEVTPWEAFVRGITGTQSQEEANAFLQMEIISKTQESRRETIKEAVKELNKARRAGSDEKAFRHYQRAKEIMMMGRLNIRERMQALRNSRERNRPLADNIDEQFKKIVLDRIEKKE